MIKYVVNYFVWLNIVKFNVINQRSWP